MRLPFHARNLAIACAAGTLAACATVPLTGRRAFNVIPDSQASSLGAETYRNTLAGAKLITGGPEYEQVLRVGRAIAAVCDEKSFAWEFNLIDDPKTVNAWCLPGGKVAVYTGILPICGNEAALAIVMGHEIAHAVARHGSERMSQALAFQLGGVALDVALREKSQETRQIFGAAYGIGGQVGVLLPFSRTHESEADRMGLTYAARAGYDPREAPRFWERMDRLGGGDRPPQFLSTHPSPSTRVRDLEKWMPEAVREYETR